MFNKKTYMNILLLYPKMTDTFWSMSHLLKVIGKKGSYPPLGLLTVASLLPPDWNKKLIDLNTCFLNDKDLAWADFVFISAMNVQSVSAREVIAKCKLHGVKTVCGGPLFTHEYESFPQVDHFVLNEAEITLPLFLDDLKSNKLQKIYKTEKFANVFESPLPQWELIDIENYAYSIVQYSRGCPYLCDFCDVTTLFGRIPRVKTPVQIIKELNAILRAGNSDMILFADDNLIGNKNVLKKELLPELITWRSENQFAPGFATQVTINLADDEELMRLMLEAGFRHIFIGIETPEEESLIASRKKQNTKRELLENIKLLQANGFIVTGGFIIGFDTDTPSVFDNQIKFISESNIVIATINLLKAPPGTELYTRMKKEKRLVDKFDFDENMSNILFKMDAEAINRGYRQVLKDVYSPEKVYERAKKFLNYYSAAKVSNPIKRRISWNDYLILLRIMIFVGLLGN
ncbi:MAG: B12-binding domain-containing radical SAM protein, partial [Melioribacteraceae bacterium]